MVIIITDQLVVDLAQIRVLFKEIEVEVNYSREEVVGAEEVRVNQPMT